LIELRSIDDWLYLLGTFWKYLRFMRLLGSPGIFRTDWLDIKESGNLIDLSGLSIYKKNWLC